MENIIMAKQISDFHKATFDNTFKALTIMQEQAEKMLQIFFIHSNGIPSEGKVVINDWIGIYKKGLIDFKDKADKNFEKVEEYFANSGVAPKAPEDRK
jgi:hypothetical protein